MATMRTLSLPAITGQAWRQTFAFLFRPFRRGMWWNLLFIAWLSGNLGGGCNLNMNLPNWGPQQTQTESVTTQTGPFSLTFRDIQKGISQVRQGIGPYRAWVGAGVLFVILFSLLFSWLGARFNFVFVDVLTTGTVAVKEPFRRHRDVAHSYFWWNLGLSLVMLVIFWGGLGWWTVTLWGAYARVPDLPLLTFFKQQIPFIAWGIGYATFFSLVATVVWIWSVDFIVPIMYQNRSGVLAAWKAYLAILGRSPWEAFKYLLWKGLLNLVGGLAATLVAVVLFVGLFLGALVLVLLGVGLAKLFPPLTIGLIVIGVILLVVVLTVLVIALSLMMVPVPVWLRLFSLHYLQALGEGYQFFPAATPAPEPT